MAVFVYLEITQISPYIILHKYHEYYENNDYWALVLQFCVCFFIWSQNVCLGRCIQLTWQHETNKCMILRNNHVYCIQVYGPWGLVDVFLLLWPGKQIQETCASHLPMSQQLCKLCLQATSTREVHNDYLNAVVTQTGYWLEGIKRHWL